MMSNIFKNKSFAIKAAPAVVRTERVPAPTKRVPVSGSHTRSSKDTPPRKTQPSRSLTTPSLDTSSRPRHNRKHKKVRQKPPAYRPLSSDSSDLECPSDLERQACKRQKLDRPVDKKRKLRSENVLWQRSAGRVDMIHAADLVRSVKKTKNTPESPSAAIVVNLQYPSPNRPERYTLIFTEDFDPAEEIITVVRTVLDFYIAEDKAKGLKDPDEGTLRRLTKAYNLLTRDKMNRDLLNNFKAAVEEYNTLINELIRDATLMKTLDLAHGMPLYMIECILQQVYARAVSPKVEILRQYENGTDNVYGELLPPLVSKILEEAGLTSQATFVDLGSGVGNVVLQAALEYGCESWGCEMMDNACTLAEAQKKEFTARCQLWGIKTGPVNLERGDFLDNPKTHAAMQRADVILVNNQAFTPDLNQRLKDLFLDLKDGCKIISLKSFVPHGHQISSRNLWDPANLLDVVEGEYHSRSVSWTDAGGKYYIATKDGTRLKDFNE